jgi:hypothetical protein
MRSSLPWTTLRGEGLAIPPATTPTPTAPRLLGLPPCSRTAASERVFHPGASTPGCGSSRTARRCPSPCRAPGARPPRGPRVDELLRLRRVLGPGSPVLAAKPFDDRSAPTRARSSGDLRVAACIELDVLVEQAEESGRVAGGEGPARQLHVLLRHRLLPRPGGLPSLLPGEKRAHGRDLAIA